MEDMPCDLHFPGLKGLELSKRKEQMGEKNRRGKKLQRIRGKKKKQGHRQEKARSFLWET